MLPAIEYFKKEEWVRTQRAIDKGAMPLIINSIKHLKTGATFEFDPLKQAFIQDALVYTLADQKEFLKAREIAFALFKDMNKLYTISLETDKVAQKTSTNDNKPKHVVAPPKRGRPIKKRA